MRQSRLPFTERVTRQLYCSTISHSLHTQDLPCNSASADHFNALHLIFPPTGILTSTIMPPDIRSFFEGRGGQPASSDKAPTKKQEVCLSIQCSYITSWRAPEDIRSVSSPPLSGTCSPLIGTFHCPFTSIHFIRPSRSSLHILSQTRLHLIVLHADTIPIVIVG